ncbi:MAG: aspartate kinase [Bacteroidia bacterium]|nr:aspartate kinase [Bacteroidia bacterium]
MVKNKTLKVLKFGGTSVGSAERMRQLTKLIVNDEPKIVVLSAMSGTTNTLVKISDYLRNNKLKEAGVEIENLYNQYIEVCNDLLQGEYNMKGKQVIKEVFEIIRNYRNEAFTFTVKEEKIILAQGEILSTHLFNLYLQQIGVKSILLDALQFMKLDENNEPDIEFTKKVLSDILNQYKDDNLFITQGYICRNVYGDIDNLKRGGSDYTASIIGAAICASEIQIWTDIDGMHNNDPRVVSRTYPVNYLSFDEAAELAYFGAKILHPACILPAQKEQVPVILKNTMQPQAAGTIITNAFPNEGFKAVAAKDNITALQIKSYRMLLAYGFLRTIFEIFERYKTSIDMITTSEVAVSVTIDDTTNLDPIVNELKQIASVEIIPEQTIICVAGYLPKNKPGYLFKVTEALKDIPVSMISYGGSDFNISVLVSSKYKKQAMEQLNKVLFNL